MTHPLLGRYEEIAAVSARMLDAARASDWDGLAAQEHECARLIESLRALEPETTLKLEPAHNRQRVRVLRQILGHEALLRSAGLAHLTNGMQARSPSG
jgi:flagellar protein FliT